MSEDKTQLYTEEVTETTATATENNVAVETAAVTTKTKTRNASKVVQKKKTTENQPMRGLPKSGRPWKTPKKKFSTIKKSTPRLSFEKKMELRNELRHIKEVSREIREKYKEAAELKKQRRIKNAERRLANERRAEVVQVIKNPVKLKRMKKKQMRMIEKRDISQVKVV
ncbi:coiled-coil domain-containing protein 86 [Eurosta solidaginis]|uniref:coiled-coil domain-containing protein 86 n=1 Tax=Eurosta solidaginis TaxID=178769 RepID=UPI0035309CE3